MVVHKGKTFHVRTLVSTKPNRYSFKTIKEGDELPEEMVQSQPSLNTEERIKDFADDLADDGKRNYSNDTKRKSPGRKKKTKKPSKGRKK